MSSSENPRVAAPRDGNPFDISRRSEEEVAAEIAARLSAWKQARARASAAPPMGDSRPHPEPTPRSTPASAPAPIPGPSLSAPARIPKFGEYVTAPTIGDGSEEPGPRTLPDPSVVLRRAIPAAPSLRPKPQPVVAMPERTMPEPRPAHSDQPDSEWLAVDDEAPELLGVPEPIVPRLEAPRRDYAIIQPPPAQNSTHAWAIGLGALLLALGVTLPAAFWQRSEIPAELDQQVVAVSPVPAAPDSTSPAVKPDAFAERRAQSAMDSYGTLAGIRTGGDVAIAPIIKPPPPAEETAAAPETQPDEPVALQASAYPLVARPFVSDGGAEVLQLPPGTAAKPVMAARVKPTAASVAVPSATKKNSVRPVAPKPAKKPVRKQGVQSLDQMFNTLINSLSNGQPANPDTQPEPPSNRR